MAKYTRQEFYFCIETAAIFKSIVRPHFQTKNFSLQVCKGLIFEAGHRFVNFFRVTYFIRKFYFQWVYNILEHKKEADRIVFEDSDDSNGFIMLPDLKWNGEKPEELYLVAIVHRKDLGSLRDLRHEHIELLENILTKGKVGVSVNFSDFFL